jgi:tetratricopeptide (TPR) repeat protein
MPASSPHSRRGSRTFTAILAILAFFAGTPAAQAQRQPFIEHLVAFRSLLFGPYGDEGPRAAAELDALSAALTAWDAQLAAEEARLRRTLIGAPTAVAADTRITLATLFAGRGRWAAALAEVDSALAIDPQRRTGVILRARLLDALGRRADAAAAYRHAFEMDATDAVAAYFAFEPSASIDGLGGVVASVSALLESQRKTRAEGTSAPLRVPALVGELIPDTASATPLFAPVRYADGFAAIADSKYDAGVAALRAAVASDPLVTDGVSRSRPMVHALTLLHTGMMADAIAPLEAVVAAHPDSSEAHRILGAVYSAVGGHDAEAIEQLRHAVELAPDDERTRLALGRALYTAGRTGEAIESLRETMAQMPASGEAWLMLANALEKVGDSAGAMAALDTAASREVIAGEASLDWHAAELHDLHQDFDRVATLLRRRVRLDPNNAAFHKQLGLEQSRRGFRDEALAELAMTDLLGGADAESLTALGQALLRSDRVEHAEAVLRRAVTLQPDRQAARYALGRALLRAGRSAEAREQLAAFQQIRARTMEEQRRSFEIDKLRAEAAREAAAGHVDRLAAIWRDIAGRRPDVIEFQIAAADAHVALGDFDAAVAFLHKAAQLGGGVAVQQRLAAVYAKRQPK